MSMTPYTIPKDFYGDRNRWFIGTIVNATPPAGYEGRVRVRIHGVHSIYTGDVKESDLPWAQVLIPTTEGGISGLGRIPQISAGASVFGIFLDGKTSQLPLVLGSVPRNELPSTTQQRAGQDINSFQFNQEKLLNVVTASLLGDTSRTGLPTVTKILRRSQAMQFFIDNGYRPVHAAGIVGNLEAASKFYLYEDDETKERQGIAQWSNLSDNRLGELKSFSGFYEPSSDWKTYSVQLSFVLFELRNKRNLANVKLLSSDNVQDAGDAFNKYYMKQGLEYTSLCEEALDGVNN